MHIQRLDSQLREWRDYAEDAEWESILIGNGASRAVWEGFSYPSLFQVAQDSELTDRLSTEDVALFGHLGQTTNFEGVLNALLTTQTVADALDLQPVDRVSQRYQSIQKALVAAVHRVHVPWRTVPETHLQQIREELLNYEYIFSSNYDLLLYWAIMGGTPSDFKDYFWGGSFDVSNTEIWDTACKVLYLHGALHLYYDADGSTYKERAEDYSNLLDKFGRRPNAVPLCITEGTSAQKLSAIARSDYLSFAFQQFGSLSAPLVVLGAALGEMDAHLVEVLARRKKRLIAVGIYPKSDTQVVREKAHYIRAMPSAALLFFDSRSHPLADPQLRIPHE